MTAEDWISNWEKSAEDDFVTVNTLFKYKRYHHCLFFFHLAIEKLLKGLIIKNIDDAAPPIHNLNKLAEIGKITVSPEYDKYLKEITTWNVKARYTFIKDLLYKKATKEYATQWFKKAKEVYQWLLNQY